MSIVFLNGKFLDAQKACIPITDHGFLYGDGVYETMRNYGDKVWQLKDHMDRISASLKLLNIKVPWSKKEIGNFVEKTVKKNLSFLKGNQFLRIRLTITRGSNHFDFMTTNKPTILVTTSVEKEYLQEKGLKVISFDGGRVAANAKHLSQIINIMAKQKAIKAKKDDAIFVDSHGFVSEGAYSNVFMVKRGRLFTPDIDGILSGTTRKIILSYADKIAPTKESKILLKQLYKADELFISGSIKRIEWVSEIDGYKIGDGKMGPITTKIKEEYETRIAKFKGL